MRKPAILLGDEAIALGATHAGISGVYGYPGTPSTEIFEAVEQFDREKKIHHTWSTNEKVAYEQALGMSFAGKRVMVTMKHVGLNVAADPFVNSAITGINGGLVLVVADDPGMHSSQNEQDTRYYAQLAMLPLLEPATQQQAYDMSHRAFDLSERLGVPIIIRVVTRLAHSRANVFPVAEGRPQNLLHPSKDRGSWILLPMNARRNFEKLAAKQNTFLEESEASSDNRIRLIPGRRKGVIMNGIAANYFHENLGYDQEQYNVLHICQYPIPTSMVHRIVDACDEILVLEEGYPYIEEQVTGLLGIAGKKIHGKHSGALPRTGELAPDNVRKALGLPPWPTLPTVATTLAGRPPQLCSGCPHTSTFSALVEAMIDFKDGKVFGDIGCYTLAALPPLNAIESCVDMGASISMGIGAAHAGVRPAIAALGDSTFTHSGIPALLDAARDNVPLTVIILDNATTGMTGAQESAATGSKLVNIICGLGIPDEHIIGIEPLPKNHKENVEVFRREFRHEGLSVVIAQRDCLTALKKKRAEGRAKEVA